MEGGRSGRRKEGEEPGSGCGGLTLGAFSSCPELVSEAPGKTQWKAGLVGQSGPPVRAQSMSGGGEQAPPMEGAREWAGGPTLTLVACFSPTHTLGSL